MVKPRAGFACCHKGNAEMKFEMMELRICAMSSGVTKMFS